MLFDLFICSSDSEKDKRLGRELFKHLSTLRNQGVIQDRFFDATVPGSQEEAQIFQYLNGANIIILLITPDFTDSHFCQKIMERALMRHSKKETRVIPVILRPIDYEGATFAKLAMLPEGGKALTDWEDQDTAFVNVVQGLKKVIADLTPTSLVSKEEILRKAEQGTELISNLPFRQNPYFTGRDEVLARLHDTFTKGNRLQLLSGISAIGKTQAALAYAYRYSEDYQYSEGYQYLLWVGADTRARLESGFAKLAWVLDLPEKSEQDQSGAVAAVKGWLQIHDKWLLILDNADNLEMVYHFLPENIKGHMLLTARSRQQEREISGQRLEEMNEDEGALFLLHRAKLLSLEKKGLETLPEAEQSKAREIARMIDGQPLALELAGGYIASTKCSLDDYIKHYQERVKTDQSGLTQDQPDPVDTTWSLSFKMVEQTYPGAADLLRLYAFLHPDTIPEEMITRDSEALTSALQDIVKDDEIFDNVIDKLRKYSLVGPYAENNTLTIHRQGQRILKQGMDEAKQREWAERAIKVVNRAFHSEPTEVKHWAQCERVLPQALECAELSKKWHFTLPEVPHLLNKMAIYLKHRGRYEEAEQFFKDALDIRKLMLGTQHLDVAQSFNNLAELYRRLGKFDEAKEHYQSAQAIYEQMLHLIPAYLATTLNNLANMCIERSQFVEAKALFQNSLEVCQQFLGMNHPLTKDTALHVEHLMKNGSEKEEEE